MANQVTDRVTVGVPWSEFPAGAGAIVSATVVGLPSGSRPTVKLGGTPGEQTIEFGIPEGESVGSEAEPDGSVSKSLASGTASNLATQAPFRSYGVQITVATTRGEGDGEVVFPVGLFTAPPVVQVTKATPDGASLVPYVSNITTESCTIGLQNPSEKSGDVSVVCGVVATQFTDAGLAGSEI